MLDNAESGSSSLCSALPTHSPWCPSSLCHCVILCFDVHSRQEVGISPFLTYSGCTDFCALSPLNFSHLSPQISLIFLLTLLSSSEFLHHPAIACYILLFIYWLPVLVLPTGTISRFLPLMFGVWVGFFPSLIL